jgi:uncharacterized protein (TIGR00251 family)
MRIRVRVVPRSSKNAISQEGEIFKVRLLAPPVDGAANEALLTFLAERLHLSRRSLTLIQGANARQKVVQIDAPSHLSDAELVKRLCSST